MNCDPTMNCQRSASATWTNPACANMCHLYIQSKTKRLLSASQCGAVTQRYCNVTALNGTYLANSAWMRKAALFMWKLRSVSKKPERIFIT